MVSSTGSWSRGEVYAGGRRVATYNNGTTYFDITDWLGTDRVRSTVSGTVYQSCTSLPFGDNFYCPGSDASPMHFNGKVHTYESGIDDFGARYLEDTMGRFMSPDPMGGMRAQPQSLNRYAYVLDNPLRFTDPLGLWHCDWGNGEFDDTEENGGASQAECQAQGGANWVSDEGDIEGIPSGAISYCLNCLASLASVANSTTETTSSSADEPQVGLNIFTNNPQCPNCGNIWNGANNVVNLATAYTVAAPTLGIGGVTVGPTIAAYATGWGYAAAGAGSGFVLGLYPAYLEAAEEGGSALTIFPLACTIFSRLQAMPGRPTRRILICRFSWADKRTWRGQRL